MNYVERKLDTLTMYQVVLSALLTIAFTALVLSVAGVLFIAPIALLASFCVIVVSVILTHKLCIRLSGAPGNFSSSLITGLILFLILTPQQSVTDLTVLALISFLAIALKYVVRWRLRHVFNPVALALFLTGLTGYYGAEWWVGSRYLLPVVLIVAVLVVMKTRRWQLFLTYVVASALCAMLAFSDTTPIYATIVRHIISWPTIFFAAFMLTEPLGMPGTKLHQYVFAMLAALLSSVPFSIGFIHGTPELALLVANLFTVVIDRPERLRLKFLRKKNVGKETVEYSFAVDRPVSFKSGQFLEWTLPHRAPDARGIRRYFTISSATNTREVSFAVRHSGRSSSFKTELSRMVPATQLFATQRAGDFTLRTAAQQQVFIAGGIGVTPFMSMLRSAVVEQSSLTATLFYCNKTEADIAFLDELTLATTIGLTTVHVLGEAPVQPLIHEVGYITQPILTRHVNEWPQATFYISGPPPLVDSYKKMLRSFGVPRQQIVTDYFPGLA